ncbi:Protein of unknown function [Bacillus cytotoxicus]|uniref:Uncharacterized protein n=1 Tax=Bacillus cytotoxicus TaxID=580165 RepID=A0AAX2CFB4_9BACI|nr:Protein of unknown function [Bacillus cytotoxicus]SCN34618.1 Protein of unknown function [Bacillus cytotoxicus]
MSSAALAVGYDREVATRNSAFRVTG